MARFATGPALDERPSPRFGSGAPLPEEEHKFSGSGDPGKGFSFIEEQEITLPSGEKRKIDVLTPEARRLFLEAGLSIAGGAVGRGVATAAPLIGGMIGSGAGAAGGAALAGAKPADIAISGAVGAGAEGVGYLGLKFARKMFGRSPKILKGAEEAQALLNSRGASLTPAQATSAFGTDVVENIGEASLLGGGAIKETKERAFHAASDAAREWADALSGTATKEELGQHLLDAIEGQTDAFKQAASGMYAKVQGAAPEGVRIMAVKDEAKRLLSQAKRGLRKGQSSPIIDITNDVLERADKISWEEAAAIRSDLGAFRASSTDVIPTKTRGAAKSLFGKVDGAMTTAGESQSGEALIAWREANAFYKEGHQKFNNRFIKALAQRSPDQVYDAAIKAKRPGAIRQVMSLLQDEEKTSVRGQFLQDWLTKSTDANGELVGNKMANSLKSFSDAAIDELMGTGGREKAKLFARTIQLNQSKTEIGNMKMIIQFAQAGAIMQLVTPGVPGSATSVGMLLGPHLLAKLYDSPVGYRLLVTGFKAAPGTKVAADAITKLSAFIAKEQIGMLKDHAKDKSVLKTALVQQ